MMSHALYKEVSPRLDVSPKSIDSYDSPLYRDSTFHSAYRKLYKRLKRLNIG